MNSSRLHRILILLSIPALLWMQSCGEDHTYSIDDSLARVLYVDTLYVGFSEQEFFSYTEPLTEHVAGLDADIAREVTRVMGVHVQFRRLVPEDAPQRLDIGWIDIYWSGLELPDNISSRNRNMIYSSPYYTRAGVQYAAGFQRNAGALRKEVDRILAVMKKNGILDDIIQTHTPD